MFFKIGVFKNFANFTPLSESVFNIVTGLQTCNFIKKETLAQVFS